MRKTMLKKHFEQIEHLARIAKETGGDPKRCYEIESLIASRLEAIGELLDQYEMADLGFVDNHRKMPTEGEILNASTMR